MGLILLLGLSATGWGAPKVEWHGLVYIYNFFHSNTDFNKDTPDGNSFMYIHGDIQYSVDFGEGVSLYSMIGAWGQHGINPYWGVDLQGNSDPVVRLLQAYLTVEHIFDSPLSLRIGKERLLYGDGLIFFDGGEDGAIQAKLMFDHGPLNLDLFYSRLAQSHGIANVGAATYGSYDVGNSDTYPGNINMLAAYGTYKVNDNTQVSAYWVKRPQQINDSQSAGPTWLGSRVEAALGGLNLTGEYALMGGKDESADAPNFKGSALEAKADYQLRKLGIGAAYCMFSGDDTTTHQDNELYESATQGPFTFGFYKDWPGFGPAHLMTTGYGFAGLDPGNLTMTNLNTLNFHVSGSLGALNIRFDYFNYSRNWVGNGGHASMGSEMAILLKYNYRDKITFGATAGIWSPGDYWKQDLGLNDKAGNAMGGYFYLADEF